MNYKECLMKDQLFNRKILFSLLAVVMCLGFTAMSYGQAVVSVDPAEVESPAVGEELMVNINIAGGAGVAGYQVTVNFDPTALSLCFWWERRLFARRCLCSTSYYD